MAEQDKKYVTLYNHWRNYNILDFVKRAHVFFTDGENQETNLEDVAKHLFDLNKENIFNQMSDEEKREWAYWDATGNYPTSQDKTKNGGKDFEETIKDKYPTSADDLDDYEMRLPYPCKLKIEAHCITSELMISQTNFQVQTDDVFAFADERIQEILAEEETGINFSKSEPKVTVYLWSKSAAHSSLSYSFGQFDNSKNVGWLDLSDYVVSMSTNVGQQGGTFNLHFVFQKNLGNAKSTGWFASIETGEKVVKYGNELREFNDFSTNKNQRLDYNSSDGESYFTKIISPNDLVMLSFSALELDNKEESWLEQGTAVAKSAAANSFDLIGLIDNISVQRTAQNGSISIDVTGRDLSKLLSDDGTFFFNYSTTKDPSRIFWNADGYGNQGDVRDVWKTDGKMLAINRMRRPMNEIDIFCNQINQSIDYVIKGVISQLANIEVVPGSAFTHWQNRTTWYETHPDEEIKDVENPKSEVPEISVDKKE